MAHAGALDKLSVTWRHAVSSVVQALQIRAELTLDLRDFIPLYLARGFSLFYNVIDPVPSWLLTLVRSVWEL